MTITGETRTDKQLAENALMGKLVKNADHIGEYIGIVDKVQYYWEYVGDRRPNPHRNTALRIVVTFRSSDGSEYRKWLDQGVWEVWQ